MKKAICENGGCMAKLPGNELSALLSHSRKLATIDSINSNEIVFDDCAVVDCPSEKILLTTDQNPPVGHDPFIAGKIAAFHSISDVYAMGGKPLFALAIFVMGNDTTIEQGEQYMRGIFDACSEDGVLVVGGHTIHSVEPIIGLSVLGIPSDCNKIGNKKNCSVGDGIYISKRLGTSLALRGYYNKLLDESAYNSAIEIMTQSNRYVTQVFPDDRIHAITDVTGFGLLGHLSEMLISNQGAIIDIQSVPLIEEIKSLSSTQMKTVYTDANYAYVIHRKRIRSRIDSIEKLALLDPQTNGSILVIANKEATAFLNENGFQYIGEITDTDEIVIR